MAMVRGGRTTYGHELGVLMLDTRFPRLVGDIGNAASFPFPVLYRKVEGASPRRVVEEADPALIEPFVQAAKALEADRVKAIATSCGFLALFQRELAAAVRVPVYTSSLLQLPLLYEAYGRRGKAGVLTARAASLTWRHFEACGAGSVPTAIAGMDGYAEFTRVFLERGEVGAEPALDADLVETELSRAAAELVESEPEVEFIVLECTNMPPFKDAIRKASGRPVYDILSLLRYALSGLGGTGAAA